MKRKHSFYSPLLFVFGCLVLLQACQKSVNPDLEKSQAKAVSNAYELGIKALKKQEKREAFRNFSVAVGEFERNKDSVMILYPLFEMAKMQLEFNDYSELEATCVQAISYFNSQTAPAFRANFYNYLGIAFSQQGEFEKARLTYLKSLAQANTLKDSLTIYNNLAYVRINAGEWSAAKKLLEEAAAKYDPGQFDGIQALIQDNLGYASVQSGNQEGLQQMRAALDYRIKSKDDFGAVTSYLHLAEASLKSNRVEALDYARRAENLSAVTQSIDDRLLALQFLAKESDDATAKHFLSTYFRLSDSINTLRRKTRSAFAAIKYDYRQEREKRLESETATARAEVKTVEERQVKWAMIFVVALSLVAAFFGTRYLKARGRKERLSAVYESEARIGEKLHDELANNIHQAIVFTEHHALDIPENRNKLLQNLDNAYQSTRDLSRENGRLDPSADMQEIIRDLVAKYNTSARPVLLIQMETVPWKELDEFGKIVIQRSIQELLVNMYKHSDCKRAIIRFQFENKKISVLYSDDGKGFETQGKRNGLQIMENRILAAGGKFTFESSPGNGFRAQLILPI